MNARKSGLAPFVYWECKPGVRNHPMYCNLRIYCTDLQDRKYRKINVSARVKNQPLRGTTRFKAKFPLTYFVKSKSWPSG